MFATSGASQDPATATFWRSAPGQRFQQRYWRHRDSVRRRSIAFRVAALGFAALLAVIGVLLLVLPGPGILLLAIAGALVATESLAIARALDRIEVGARRLARRVRRRFA